MSNKVKELLGDLYHEGMSAEEQLEALEQISFPQDNTDEVSRLKKARDKAMSEAADYKRKLNDHMSEEEKRTAEEAERISAIETENKELKKKIAIADYTSKFISSGLDADTAAKCAEATYSGDIDTVISSYNTKMASVKEAAKAELIAETPKIKGGATKQVKDYSEDINTAIAVGDIAKAAALTRVAQETQKNT